MQAVEAESVRTAGGSPVGIVRIEAEVVDVEGSALAAVDVAEVGPAQVVVGRLLQPAGR